MDMMQMIQAFNQFKQGFNGDAKAEVMRLIQTGQMSQSQLNQYQQMASMLQNAMGIK